MDADEDHLLLVKCIEGDKRAWTVLVEKYSRYIYFLIQATAKRHTTAIDQSEAADLHNDFFVALLEDNARRLRGYKGSNGCSIRSWLRIICVRRTIDALRKRRKFVSLDAGDDQRPIFLLTDNRPDPLDTLLIQDTAKRSEQLSLLTDALSPSDRLLLELIYVEKLSADHIASTLRIRKGAVYTRKTRLIQRLQTLATDAGLIEKSP
jgi:RNA polymerase sigma factor (sigma-70 family)